MKKHTVPALFLTTLTVSLLAGCSGSGVATTYVDMTATSSLGKLSDFSKAANEVKPGDLLTFKVTPNTDFYIEKVAVYNTISKKTILAQKIDTDNHYSFTIQEGENRITPTYIVNPEQDFVADCKLPISPEVFTEIMKDPPKEPIEKEAAYDLRKSGIEQMQTTYTDSGAFINYVDGDTTHFSTRNYGYTAKARYLAIDTPESTSEIEEWGKSASNYNKEHLSKAKHIICHGEIDTSVEPKYDDKGKPFYQFKVSTDGNQRNLLYVWYTDKETPVLDDFKCLNLEMAYQGFSFGLGSEEDLGTYYFRYFQKAVMSAQQNERHIYSSKKDPNYYYDKPVSLTLKEIYDTSTKGSTDSKYMDKKTLYRVKGYVTRKITTAFFIQDVKGGTANDDAHGMYIFTYSITPIDVGDEVEVIGVLSDYSGTYQMQGISYHDLNPDKDRDTRIISTGHTITPIELTKAQFDTKKYDHVLVNITDTIYCKNLDPYTYGGKEEKNKDNERYPFYYTNNKIVFFGVTDPNATAVFKTSLRIVSDENILISYEDTKAYSHKFFNGGSYNYNPNGAEWLDETYKPEDPRHKDTVTKTFVRKCMSITCISQNYISSSGKSQKYSAYIVNPGDVKNLKTY